MLEVATPKPNKCVSLEECFRLYQSLGLEVARITETGEPTSNPDRVKGLAVVSNEKTRILALEFPSFDSYEDWLARLGALGERLRDTLTAVKLSNNGTRVLVYLKVRAIWEVIPKPEGYREGMLIPLPPSELIEAKIEALRYDWALLEIEQEDWEKAYKAYLEVVAPKPVEDTRARLEKFLATIPEQYRAKVREILERLEIDTRSFPPMLRLGASSIPMPQSIEDLPLALEALLWRAGYGELSGLYSYYASRYLIQTLKESNESKPIIEEEKLKTTLIDEIAFKIFIELEKKYICFVNIKEEKFTKNKRPTIYCFTGLAYKDYEDWLQAEIERMARYDWKLSAKITTQLVNRVLDKIARNHIKALEGSPLKIAFINGVYFNWEKFLKGASIRDSIEPPDPNAYVIHVIPHRLAYEKLEVLEGLPKYIESLADIEKLANKLCPKAHRAFKDWVCEKGEEKCETWLALYEIIGFTLYPKNDLHKAIMLIGRGRNGKSTYIRLIEHIVGEENVTHVSLQKLTNPEHSRFNTALLYHKLVNTYGDIPREALRETSEFKILTGEDVTCADRKYRSPVCFKNYAKLIFASNELPKVEDPTDAFWRRWLVIEFPNQFDRDPTFFERTFTEEEIEGVILVSLIAFRNAWRRGKFTGEEKESEIYKTWRRNADPIVGCLEALLEGEVEGYRARLDPNARTEAPKLYQACVKYWYKEGKRIIDPRQFTMLIRGVMINGVLIEVKRPQNKTYYYGIALEEVGKSLRELSPQS